MLKRRPERTLDSGAVRPSGRIVRLFVSSTFADFRAERNALHRDVWPALQDYAAQKAWRFQVIDLRWGVSKEAGRDQRTMRICLEEIRRSQAVSPHPNFLMLLGDRYGWRPLAEEIPEPHYRLFEDALGPAVPMLRKWYCRDNNAISPIYRLLPRGGVYEEPEAWYREVERPLQEAIAAAASRMSLKEEERLRYIASATEQEVFWGALQVDPRLSQPLAFIRHFESLTVDGSARDFIDWDAQDRPDEWAARRMADLTRRVKQHVGKQNLRRYDVRFSAQGLNRDYIARLCRDVRVRLQELIDRRIEEHGRVDSDTQESAFHSAFGTSRTFAFLGRETELRRLSDYFSSKNRTVQWVTGPPGSGKTTLLAEAARRYIKRSGNTVIVQRFVGISGESHEVRSLLSGLVHEIGSRFGKPRAPDLSEMSELARELLNHLALSSRTRPLVLFLDGLDQLSNLDRFPVTAWLPTELPPYTRVVASGGGFAWRWQESIDLREFSGAEALNLIEERLYHQGRRLQAAQREVIRASLGSENSPLYATVVANQVRELASWQPPVAPDTDIEGVLSAFIQRLSAPAEHGPCLVDRVLSYLAASRHGLIEGEMLDVLSDDDAVRKELVARASNELPEVSAEPWRLPFVVWARLYHDLAPFLSERIAEGLSLINFYHRQVANVVERRLLEPHRKERHDQLATYFQRELSASVTRGDTANTRALAELPYHYTYAEQYGKLDQTLCSLDFVERKIRAGQFYDLQADLHRGNTFSDSRTLRTLGSVVQRMSRYLPLHPDLLFQSLAGYLAWEGERTEELEALLQAVRHRLASGNGWIEAISPVPDPPYLAALDYATDLQALCAETGVLAAVTEGTNLEVRRLADGELLSRRVLSIPAPQAITICDGGRIAGLGSDGIVAIEYTSATLAGRPGDQCLGFHSAYGIVVARSDDILVSWDANAGSVRSVAEPLPIPLRVLRFDAEGKRLLFVAGWDPCTIGLAMFEADAWHTRQVPYEGPPVVDADLIQGSDAILLLSQDRALRVLKVPTGRIAREHRFEIGPSQRIQGAGARCVMGRGMQREEAYVVTQIGQVGRWNTKAGHFVRLPDVSTKSAPTSILDLVSLDEERPPVLTTPMGARLLLGEDAPWSAMRHTAAVTDLAITSSDIVVSISSEGHRGLWNAVEGLRPLSDTTLLWPTRVINWDEAGRVAVGNADGGVWLLDDRPTASPGEPARFLGEQIVGMVKLGDRLLVTGVSGAAMMLEPSLRQGTYVWRATGTQELVTTRPSRGDGLQWVLRREEVEGTYRSAVARLRKPFDEQVVFTSRFLIPDLAVSSDGSLLAIAGLTAKVMRWRGTRWKKLFEREGPVAKVSFLHGDWFLAVVPEDDRWLEIWEIADGLPTYGRFPLPERASCLASRGGVVVVGMASGHLLALRVLVSDMKRKV